MWPVIASTPLLWPELNSPTSREISHEDRKVWHLVLSFSLLMMHISFSKMFVTSKGCYSTFNLCQFCLIFVLFFIILQKTNEHPFKPPMSPSQLCSTIVHIPTSKLPWTHYMKLLDRQVTKTDTYCTNWYLRFSFGFFLFVCFSVP